MNQLQPFTPIYRDYPLSERGDMPLEKLIVLPVNGYVYLSSLLPLLAYRWTLPAPIVSGQAGVNLSAVLKIVSLSNDCQRWTLSTNFSKKREFIIYWLFGWAFL